MEQKMIKSSDMTPEQRQDVVDYLEYVDDNELTPDEIEVLLDSLVDTGIVTKGQDGRYRLAKGIRVITDDEYHGE
jgi:predicted transcriptional regulator